VLIINADDFGESRVATDHIVACHGQGLITSASAMVFMADSGRAAQAALSAGLDLGLHLNLDRPFTANVSAATAGQIKAVARYLNSGKWAQAVYNPSLGRTFKELFERQYDEFCLCYGKEPSHIDGHHHRHLCMNMISGRVIPPGRWVRRSFTPERGRGSLLEKVYGRFVDAWLIKHYRCTDRFFSLEPLGDLARLQKIIRTTADLKVELMVHPAKTDQFAFLMSQEYQDRIRPAPKGTFRNLREQAGT
jgi:predicted glycoside hydrolase/deacetylase ChbG (UPF0249 family)